MIKFALLCFLASLFSGFLGAAADPEQEGAPELDAHITVRVYNYAQVPGGALAGAKSVASQIYRHAGIETAWVDCPCGENEIPKYPDCAKVPHGPTVLQVKLLSQANVRDLPIPRHDFGMALLGNNNEFAFASSVFFHHVENLAEKGVASPAVILGHVLAHEVGHLLLGRGSHSRRGIMRVPWDKRQLRRANEGRLRFTPAEMARIRKGVLARGNGNPDFAR